MEKIFWGTGSAEGLPNPVCGCLACERARKLKGKNIRGRSSFQVSKDVLLDFGPDFVRQAQKNGGDLMELRHVLVTHTHYDHFSSFALCQFAGSFILPTAPVTFYFTEEAYEMANYLCHDEMLLHNGFQETLESGAIRFEQLKFFEKRKIGNYVVIPLPGRHFGSVETRSANYLFQLPEGDVLYYGTDTGYYFPDTINFLKEYQINQLITECTWDEKHPCNLETDKHLSLLALRKLLGVLEEQGTLGRFSEVYLTHISHSHTRSHEELEKLVNNWTEFPFKVCIAYDGMKI